MSKASARPQSVKSKSADLALTIPTPAMIHALFIALRALGWRSGVEHAHGPLRWAPERQLVDADTPLPTSSQIESLFESASQLGWIPLSNEEINFMFDLRALSAEGLDLFEATASCIKDDYPWQPSLAESCAGAYKVKHYSADSAVVYPKHLSKTTAREQALCAVLSRVGWGGRLQRQGQLRPPAAPEKDAKPLRLTNAQRLAVETLARELGWSWLGPRQMDLNLIRLLRTCSDDGKNIIFSTLHAIVRRHRVRG